LSVELRVGSAEAVGRTGRIASPGECRDDRQGQGQGQGKRRLLAASIVRDLLRRLPCSLLDDREVACVARASSPCISRTLDAATSKSCGDLLRRLPCSLLDDGEVACVARASPPCIPRTLDAATSRAAICCAVFLARSSPTARSPALLARRLLASHARSTRLRVGWRSAASTSLLAPRRRRGRLRCSRVVSLHLTHARRGYE